MKHAAKHLPLALVLLLFAGLAATGITWGLPTRAIDKYLFGDDPPWSGEVIYRLAGAAGRFSAQRGADVDADPLAKPTYDPIPLTSTPEDVAKIYLRYRLYTYQPDEMITMMALSGMRPSEWNFDPRLYQYGGLFLYPVGALIKLCGLLGLIDVRSDVVYYLDHPDEFGKFYVVARAYSAAWGMVGVCIVFAIGRRLGGDRAGILAALFFTLLPVMVCMSHEGKPHLPGAVLMLIAVFFAMRRLERAPGSIPRGLKPVARHYWYTCITCGAAVGMVLSSWPIFVLIPLTVWLDSSSIPTRSIRWIRTIQGITVGLAVYLAANPYIIINAFFNREVLRSNFGNSLAMYEIDRIGEGFLRVAELTAEGASWPVSVLGVLGALVALTRMRPSQSEPFVQAKDRDSLIAESTTGPVLAHGARFPGLPLAIVAVVLVVQFVLIGAGKPAEYGRFGVFANTALAIAAACLVAGAWTKTRLIPFGCLFLFAVLGFNSGAYLWNFHADTTDEASRLQLARSMSPQALGEEYAGTHVGKVAVLAEPAPYVCPPLPFHQVDVVWFPNRERVVQSWCDEPDRRLLIRPIDRPRTGTAKEKKTWNAVTSLIHAPPYQGVASYPTQRPGHPWPRPTPISWANKPFEIAVDEWRTPFQWIDKTRLRPDQSKTPDRQAAD